MVEKRNILDGVKIEPQKAEALHVPVQVTGIFCRVLSTAGRSPVSIAPVVFQEAAAAPEPRLSVDTGRSLRCKLALGRNVASGVARPDVHLHETSDQAGANMAQRRDAGPQFDVRIF